MGEDCQSYNGWSPRGGGDHHRGVRGLGLFCSGSLPDQHSFGCTGLDRAVHPGDIYPAHSRSPEECENHH